MSGGFGGHGDAVTLQPGPFSMKLYRCPQCKRVGRARQKPKCHGSMSEPHRGVLTKPIPEKFAHEVNPHDPPVHT